jgi:2-methylaconitate cis-trans-isomerase PrpF
VGVTQAVVDWEPSCGNMLAGVGPAAIEMGLISQVDQVETKIRIRALNNGSFVEAVVQTPNGQVGARLLLQSMAIHLCLFLLREICLTSLAFRCRS